MRSKLALTSLALVVTAGCASPAPTPAAQFGPTEWGSGDVTRELLTYRDLASGFEADSPVDDAALALPVGAAPPSHVFEGRLEMLGEATSGGMSILAGDEDVGVRHLPEFDYAFVQTSDGYLVPAERGLIITDNPYWNLMLEPGRTWDENGDNGLTRASFPFALVWKDSNAILNGTMTFLFDDQSVSKVWYQITQETTVTFRADLWGLLDATYHPGPVDGADTLRNAFAAELAARMPTKPIEQLATNHPGIDLSAFGAGVTPENMTWYGFVVDGVNYVGGCQTRYGTYPYCTSMRAPSYSTAKSGFVAIALMRLTEKYGTDVPDLFVKDYVPETADSPGDWSAVTFDDLLDMASGNFTTSAYMVDEEHWDDAFWTAQYKDPMLADALHYPHGADPGTTWVYHTSDTFILVDALQNYLRSKEGPDADLFRFVVDEVYRPLGLGPGLFATMRTRDDDWKGQALGGQGLWWIPDDLAKLAVFLNVDDGAVDGQHLLDPDLLAAALQRDPADPGVDRVGGGRYNDSFWADQATGLGCEVWVPMEVGYSGIVVALFPNGTAYYYASDGQEFTSSAALREAGEIYPYCP
ncbi:MAG: serine hydrolase domain-containing protein [Acidimicrobiia bacterium]